MSVLDASLLIDVVVGLPAGRPWRSWVAHADRLAAPDCLGVEFGRYLRRHLLAGRLALDDVDRALTTLHALGIEMYPTAPLLGDAMTLRDDATFDDALYLALAQRLDEPLATNDRKLARAAVTVGVPVLTAP